VTDDDQYRCLLAPAVGDYRERGSKFLSYAYPCDAEEVLKAYIQALKKQHPSARHFCYGAVLGAENPEERSSDAGEPSGTAGLPILNQLLSANLKNCAIVVVRYFGGTKLGKPGLIHAYKESARAALSSARIGQRFIVRSIQLIFDYPQSGTVMRVIGQLPHARIAAQEFMERCKIVLEVPKSEVANTVYLFDRLPMVHVSPMD